MTATAPTTVPTIVPTIVPNTVHAGVGDDPDALAGIYRDEVNLAVWQRQPDPSLAAEARWLLADQGFNGLKLTLPTARLASFDRFLPGLESCPRLRADLHLLSDMFSCLFDLQCVGLRLGALTSAMCPKFHVDRVTCRLICTYTGAGTEWLPNHSVDRGKLGVASGGLDDAASGLYPSPRAIQQLAAGDVALLKGEAWQGNEGAGLVHRSPAVETGQPRLLLTLDAM
ncbi:DUF1826 domain-containing protein [Parahaliea mediterranea]|uniref:DUF1826 domain-containing protein n=1 Tax=Parahaliea mediterranea TaxID=651086 RepID=A0A939DDD0_9GAMM|nr:DUF1826 domain-containing protein [Parahaliea mediterranea]MBN7796086.1 DUF1826 domain-containing protein [Parahaliea mediterranea]